jgi:hypothetical protein
MLPHSGLAALSEPRLMLILSPPIFGLVEVMA